MSMKHDLAETKKEVAVLEKDNEVRLSQLHEATSGNMLRFVSEMMYTDCKFIKIKIRFQNSFSSLSVMRDYSD